MDEENKGEPFELRLREGTVFYEKKQLEDRLKQIDELANLLHKHLRSYYEDYYDPSNSLDGKNVHQILCKIMEHCE